MGYISCRNSRSLISCSYEWVLWKDEGEDDEYKDEESVGSNY